MSKIKNLWGCSTKALEIISWDALRQVFMWDLLECNGYLNWKISVLHLYDSVYLSGMLKKYWFGLWTDNIPGALYVLLFNVSVAWLLMLKILKDLAGIFTFRYWLCSIWLKLPLPQKAVLLFSSDSSLIICDLYSCQFEII